jgi:DNA repair exonuclease SbcCD ATPase subunit
MSQRHAIFRRISPEEAELPQRRAELDALREELAERDQELARLRGQLHHFEGRYIRQVGVLYIQLDEWETRITRLRVSGESMEDTERLLKEAMKKASSRPDGASESQPAEPKVSATHDLRALFRELAKRIHPDFARDAADERHRTQLMAQANDALLRNDPDLLHRMLHGHDLPHDHTASPAAELARTHQLLEHLQTDLATLDAELRALRGSEMADLRSRTAEAALAGRDLLAELAAQVKGRIGIAMRRYELDLGRHRRKEAAFNPEPLLSAEAPDSR